MNLIWTSFLRKLEFNLLFVYFLFLSIQGVAIVIAFLVSAVFHEVYCFVSEFMLLFSSISILIESVVSLEWELAFSLFLKWECWGDWGSGNWLSIMILWRIVGLETERMALSPSIRKLIDLRSQARVSYLDIRHPGMCTVGNLLLYSSWDQAQSE